MTRRSSLRTRLQRLEEIRQKQNNAAWREAWIVMGDSPGEQHLVLTGTEGGRSFFREMPGAGPQIADFGRFDVVVALTPDEANF